MGTRRMEVSKTRTSGMIALAVILAVVAVLLGGAAPAQKAYADSDSGMVLKAQEAISDESAQVGGFGYKIWGNENAASVALSSYSGTSTQFELPKTVTYKSKALNKTLTYSTDGKTGGRGEFYTTGAFSSNTKITKVAVPDGYEYVGVNTFYACSSLTEVAIGASVTGIDQKAFTGCTSLKKYYVNANVSIDESTGIATDANGNPIEGVTVYYKKGNTNVLNSINSINEARKTKYGSDKYKINLVAVDNPYAMINIKSSSTDLAKQMGTDGTALGKGASSVAANNYLKAYKSEKDPKGSKFYLLKAKITKTKKGSVTLSWSSTAGAKKYVVYGNKCGAKNKMVQLLTTTKKKNTFTKVNGAKVKKGTYYKFIVVALDANNNVVSTSKTVHAATPGGKVGNDKKVTTAAKRNKVTVKVKKTFKLKAKAVPVSKKLKVKRHRGVAYESDNPAIATVTAKGVIKGVKKGKCNVYAYAQNGVCTKIKVTVK